MAGFLHGIEIVTLDDDSGSGGVGAPGYPVPYFATTPTVSGTPAPGHTLVADLGQVVNGIPDAHGWLRNGVSVSGDRGLGDINLTLSESDVGSLITFFVSAHGSGGIVLDVSLSITVAEAASGAAGMLDFSDPAQSALQ